MEYLRNILVFMALTVSHFALANVPNRGLLANTMFNNQPMRGLYFFPGQSRDERVYTAHPALSEDKTWLSVPGSRPGILDRIVATNTNVLVLSWWSNMPQWSPMDPGATPILDVLSAARGKALVIMPAIESGSDPLRPSVAHYEFHEDFPYVDGLASWRTLAPGLLTRVSELIQSFKGHMDQWAQIYDRDGVPRYAIHLLHVYANSVPTVPGQSAEQVFARAFGMVAQQIESTYRIKIGFTLDIIPGPEGTMTLVPDKSGPALEAEPAILAIQGYASEVFSGLVKTNGPMGSPYDNNRDNLYNLVDWKSRALGDWVRTGIPVIYDVSSGFDGRYVWFRQGAGFWGDNLNYTDDRWRNALSQFKGNGIVGITFNTWNGYTEGYAAAPTLEHGDTVYNWLRDLYDSDPRDCSHMHYVNGVATFRVYGLICKAWVHSGGDRGPLGAPISNEQASAHGRVSYFSNGGGYWSPSTDAHIVYGLIFKTYRSMGEDRSCLGLPLSDETPFGHGGRMSRFQGGLITWMPGDALGTAHCRP